MKYHFVISKIICTGIEICLYDYTVNQKIIVGLESMIADGQKCRCFGKVGGRDSAAI